MAFMTSILTSTQLLGTGWFIYLYDERKRYNYSSVTAPPFSFQDSRQDGIVALERICAMWFQQKYCSENQKDNNIYVILMYMEHIFLRICQYTVRVGLMEYQLNDF